MNLLLGIVPSTYKQAALKLHSAVQMSSALIILLFINEYTNMTKTNSNNKWFRMNNHGFQYNAYVSEMTRAFQHNFELKLHI